MSTELNYRVKMCHKIMMNKVHSIVPATINVTEKPMKQKKLAKVNMFIFPFNFKPIIFI